MIAGQTTANERITPVTTRRTLVLVDDLVKDALPEGIAALQQAGAVVEFVDYRRLGSYVERLREVVREQEIDFVLFSRNDQVFEKRSIGHIIRALRVGYSSFSGLDTANYIEQTRVCLDDYLAGDALLEPVVSSPNARRRSLDGKSPAGTFSLIFDLEQIGGARFGLPRILELLDRYGATATFFTTNFIREIYRDVVDVLTERGHEVALHGLYHEYLAGRPLDEQTATIGEMKQNFGPRAQITGANFIGRMDADTVRAMVANGLRYWVVFIEHRYSLFAYRKMPLRPLPMWTPEGTLWLVPISVETNNRPWFSVRNMLDSSVAAAKADGWPHVNVLLHPFRDGTLTHIKDLERILVHMHERGYRGVPVAGVISEPAEQERDSFIYYPLDGSNGVSDQVRKRSARMWWHNASRYQQRVWRLHGLLEAEGKRPALCLDLPEEGALYAIYPHIPGDSSTLKLIETDPLLARQLPGAEGSAKGAEGQQISALMPGGKGNLTSVAGAMMPRTWRDVRGLIPEVALRAAYRLTPGRHIF